MKVHFIAIGGSAMHNLAIALHHKGYTVTGSDDEIFDPARSRLQQLGLLPPAEGWFPERITPDLDAVVLGMHARIDNPELLRAQELGLKIYSYPEYLYEQSKDKLRIVVGGSHGKTTTTAMILHVLKHCNIEADYMVGAQLQGFDVMVRLSNTAKVMVIEGDEYLTSPIDPRPKFHLYRPHVGIITGIEWDHINVFPTFENYKSQFAKYIDLIEEGGTLIYCDDDPVVHEVAMANRRTDIAKLPYDVPQYYVEEGVTWLSATDGREAVPLEIFGRHNLLNLTAARLACRELGVQDADFDAAIQSFAGASKRLECLYKSQRYALYKDFAHAPSKLRATIAATREQFADSCLVACMELHTYSSLSANFLSHYAGCMAQADVPFVYFNPHALKLKKLPPLEREQVAQAFGIPVEQVFNDSKALKATLLDVVDNTAAEGRKCTLLMMSSGNFDGLDFNQLANELQNKES
ncbi:MAG: peptidoglycan synthetase [Bacteroidales bacterium]|nr:peptidoglycan synthetase [Bacteroidales bacterium]